jgi:hypothetical protein
MLNIENSFRYGIYVGFAFLIIGILVGIDDYKNRILFRSNKDFSKYKYFNKVVEFSLILALVGFLIGYLYPIILNSLLYLMIVFLILFVVFIGLFRLYNLNTYNNIYLYPNPNSNSNSNSKNVMLNYTVEYEPNNQTNVNSNKNIFSLSFLRKKFF